MNIKERMDRIVDLFEQDDKCVISQFVLTEQDYRKCKLCIGEPTTYRGISVRQTVGHRSYAVIEL